MIETQKNLQPISEKEVDYSISKLIIILLFGAAIAVGLGYSLALGGIVRIVLFSAGLLILLSLQSLFVKDLGRLALFVLAETVFLAGAILFWNRTVPLEVFGAGVGLFFIFAFLGSRNGRLESESSLKINFVRVSKPVISGSLIGLLILEGVMLSIAVNPSSDQWISKKSFEKNFSQPVIGFIKPFLPGISAKMKTSDFLSKIAEKGVASMNIGGVGFSQLPATSQKQYLATMTNELQKTAERFTGATLSLSTSVSDNLYTIVKSKVGGLVGKMPFWIFAAVITATLLITVETFAWFFNWLLSFIAWLLYEVLVFFGFVRVGLENRSREIVILR
jgi:hypothetical protein